MHIAILLTGHAYLPEAWAYRDHLLARGHRPLLIDRADDAAGADLAIVFTLSDQWRMHWLGVPAVHEYHSLSAGRGRVIKDIAKRFGAPRPRGRIFTEEPIRRRLGFATRRPTLMRPVGVDAAMIDCARGAQPDHDIVFCGSLQRVGVLPMIEHLARRGWRMLVIGHVPAGIDLAAYATLPISFTGALSRADLPAALARARFGLNVTPDIFPFHRQTSTKCLEYAAAGLGIISNRYRWAEEFAAAFDFPMIWLDDILPLAPDAAHRLSPPPFDTGRIADLRWDRLLDRVGFIDFLAKLT